MYLYIYEKPFRTVEGQVMKYGRNEKIQKNHYLATINIHLGKTHKRILKC